MSGVSMNTAQYLSLDGDNLVTQPGGKLVSMTYVGAFKAPSGEDWSNQLGRIGYNPDNDSLYYSDNLGDEVGEFSIPTIVNDADPANLNRGTQLQAKVNLTTIISNPDELDRMSGFQYFPGTPPELLISAYQQYDAATDNNDTTMVLRDADDLASGTYEGWYEMSGNALASAWISPIPPEFQAALGGNYIAGGNNNADIVSRLSVGGSAWVFNYTLGDTLADPVTATAVLSYSITNPIHPDWDNQDADDAPPPDNPPPAIFSWISQGFWGGIIPNTRTYAVFGRSGGHESSICYKCTPTGGSLCGGYCATIQSDNHAFYWLYKVDDMISVKLGALNAYDPQPYEYGYWTGLQYNTEVGIAGGALDIAGNRLILNMNMAITAGLELEPAYLVFDLPQ